MLPIPKITTSKIIIACGQQIRMIYDSLYRTWFKITKIIRVPRRLDYFLQQILRVKLRLQSIPVLQRHID